MLWRYLVFVFGFAMLQVGSRPCERGRFLTPSLSLCPIALLFSVSIKWNSTLMRQG